MNSSLHHRTLLRFAHAFDTGGGTERYLDDVDRALLERNEMTILRLRLTKAAVPERSEAAVGRGRLVQVALPVIPGSATGGTTKRLAFKQRLRNAVLYRRWIWRTVGAKWASSRPLPAKPGEAIGAGAAAAALLREFQVDLAVLHFFGGNDADEVIRTARAARVPVALINHYANDRFDHLSIRRHTMLAQAVAGVNGLQVPRELRKRFVNVSDGIDTEFFQLAHARPVTPPIARPLILLPARITPEKGQADLVQAAAILRAKNLPFGVGFAGRTDDARFVAELKSLIRQHNLEETVAFLGDLDVHALRDWYAASTLVAFPTYHHEGLGRIIVEAQAMERPVVAYATGGVPDGIRSGDTGFLVATGDVSGLAVKLEQLLRAPEQRAAMGRVGRQFADTHFSLAALARRHTEFYLHAMNSGARV